MDANGNGESSVSVVASQVENLKERQENYETTNTKEHDEIRKQLQRVLDLATGEALKRWPRELAVLVTLLASVCASLITYLVTHVGG